MKNRVTTRAARRGVLVVVVASLSFLAACSSSPSQGGLQPKPGKNGLTLFTYKTSLGQVVGSIAGIVAYTNTNDSGHHFDCTSDSCTATWHPWLTDGVKVTAASGAQQSLIGTTKRPDGTIQMTYGGHPLYLYAHTKNAVQANAQGAGGVWYVVGTDGSVVK